MRLLFFITSLLVFFVNLYAQTDSKTDSASNWNYHFQLTVIDQSHAPFKASYSGQSSLSTKQEEALSLTTTVFLGRRLWKGAAVYFNPEISGGRGMSNTLGVAGFPNGETFRIGTVAPSLYLARLYYRQHLALSKEVDTVDDDINQVKELVPKERITLTAGKISLSDIFDNNNFSHDPRTQFMNWGLMNNGAWDYAANTRGYTDALVLEYANPSWSVRASTALEPTYANGPKLDYRYFKAHAETIEFQKNLNLNDRKGYIRLLGYRNVSKASSYRNVINNYLNRTDTALDIINGKKYGGVKYGFGVNADQQLTKNLGVFLRAGWNDGKTATWAFTEIDQSVSAGLQYRGAEWNRPDDHVGFAVLVNGISKNHQDFLRAGGYGFIIGDGKLLNYKTENILETYYQFKVTKSLVVAADYQFVQHPAYNADRGPVNVFAIRAHVAI